MPRVVHFDILANKPEILKKFYEDVFEWKFDKYDDPTGQMEYWLIETGKDEVGIDGGMGKRTDSDQKEAFTISVPDIEKYIEKITEKGGKILSPKMAIPGYGWIVSFLDPEGNMHMIMEEDKNAK